MSITINTYVERYLTTYRGEADTLTKRAGIAWDAHQKGLSLRDLASEVSVRRARAENGTADDDTIAALAKTGRYAVSHATLGHYVKAWGSVIDAGLTPREVPVAVAQTVRAVQRSGTADARQAVIDRVKALPADDREAAMVDGMAEAARAGKPVKVAGPKTGATDADALTPADAVPTTGDRVTLITMYATLQAWNEAVSAGTLALTPGDLTALQSALGEFSARLTHAPLAVPAGV